MKSIINTPSRIDSLCLVESRSIAVGALLLDHMLKKSSVELVRASPICSGRYFIAVSGHRADVEEALGIAQHAGYPLAYACTIGNVSPLVLEALHRKAQITPHSALGIVECRTVSASILTADSVIKKADVSLFRLSMGQGINGKSYFVVGGDISAVEAALELAKASLANFLIEATLLPRPHEEAVRAILYAVR